MRINNKEFGEWIADDLQVLLSNDAYRENLLCGLRLFCYIIGSKM